MTDNSISPCCFCTFLSLQFVYLEISVWGDNGREPAEPPPQASVLPTPAPPAPAVCAGANAGTPGGECKQTGRRVLDLYLNRSLFIGVILGGLIRYISSQFGV